MPDYTAADGAPIWFDLASSDPDRAAAFYGELFGWDVSEPNAELDGYRNFSANGRLVAGLIQAPGEGVADVWSVYFKVADAAAEVEKAQSAGGSVIVPPMPVGDLGVTALLTDPAGAAYGLWQVGSHAGFSERGTHGTPYWFDEMTMDYAASTDYYTRTLHWELEEVGTGGDPNSTGPDRYSVVTPPGAADSAAGIMSAAGMFGDGHPSFWQVYITVDDVAATLAKVTALGGEVLMPGEVTPWGTLASFKDPMGAAICLGHPPAGM
ncbi:VOC family protein [Gordonia sp. HY002]|uniref:VOC family protein n=1 Tax=Gordonia zhenghanii TaxID=2911516 RepID=UPI001EF09EEE|nr:VOC family protein [Gordonia zhenghanii]MCF8568960.1 VOC family protein [Gordonia zhenghanii]MCF8603055.1 VOC family protein [Gordonia zhenghanii]